MWILSGCVRSCWWSYRSRSCHYFCSFGCNNSVVKTNCRVGDLPSCRSSRFHVPTHGPSYHQPRTLWYCPWCPESAAGMIGFVSSKSSVHLMIMIDALLSMHCIYICWDLQHFLMRTYMISLTGTIDCIQISSISPLPGWCFKWCVLECSILQDHCLKVHYLCVGLQKLARYYCYPWNGWIVWRRQADRCKG